MRNRILNAAPPFAKAVGLSCAFLAALGLLLLQAYALVLPGLHDEARMPPTFGNFESVRALLRDDTNDRGVYFAVIGDTRGTATSEQLFHVLEKEPLDFMVLLGDIVQDGTEAAHQLFRLDWIRHYHMPFPVFYVVGNHEVDTVDFPVHRFEELYGPSNFFFGCHRCLFIVLRDLDKPIGPVTTKESLDFFETVLAEQRSRYGRVFVFMHIPPKISADFSAREFEGERRFVALCDRYRVNYVITGDYHGYARIRLRDTDYLISGGGGADLRAKVFGRFHHAVVLRVGPESVSERILYAEPKSDLAGSTRRLAATYFHPWLHRWWHLAAPIDILLAAAGFFALRSLWRMLRT
jgi:hypothetical protein